MPGCPIEQAVNGTLKDVFTEAEELLRKRFAWVTLAGVADAVPNSREHDGGQRCASSA
jgi:hypothetical protein